MTPRFSVVIPTLRRSALLAGALRSVLAQTFGDFELIVSNNGGDPATDRVARATGDRRVRVVASGGVLPMHEHWTFALSAARGQIVTILSDDDALHPRALEIVDRIARCTGADALFWRSCTHFAADWIEPADRGRLTFGPPFTDAWCPVDPGALLDHAFEMRAGLHAPMPRMLSTAATADLLARLAGAGTPLFVPSCPDYAAALALAAHAERMVFLDAPLYVSGATAHSIGAGSVRRADVTQAFVDDLLRREPDLALLPAMITPSCWIAQTYEECARRMPPLAGRRVNRAHLYAIAAQEIEMIRSSGAPVDDLEATLDAALAGPLAPVAGEVRRLRERGVTLHAEGYIDRPSDDTPLLGRGPFHAPGRSAARGAATIDAAAAEIDGWLDEEAVSLVPVPEHVRAMARGRSIVLYGLGRMGFALTRLLRPAFGATLLGCDDRAGATPPSVRRVEPSVLRVDRHFVLVTPDEPGVISERLGRAGFARGRDWATPMTALRCAVPASRAPVRSGPPSR